MKGSVQDVMFISLVVLILGILVVSGYLALSYITGTVIDQNGVVTDTRNALLTFDSMFMFLLVFLSIGALAGAALVRSHPIFLAVDLLLIIIMVFVGSALTNVYYTFASTTQIATSAAAFPNVLFIIEHLPHYIALMGIMIAIVYYGKGRQEVGTGGTYG